MILHYSAGNSNDEDNGDVNGWVEIAWYYVSHLSYAVSRTAVAHI